MVFSIISSLISTAKAAPTTEPTIAGKASQIPSLKVKTFCFLKLLTPTIFCIRMAIRFVPLATFAGNPININIAKLTTDPLPASVFKNPENTPTKTIKT